MKRLWIKRAVAIMLAATLMIPSYAVFADEAETASVSETYQLSEQLEVSLKSLLNERIAEGIQVGSVIRIKNTGSKITRIPEYELRITTDDEVSYTLQPSPLNLKSVQPKSTVELNYFSILDRNDEITLSKLSWVDVDEYVYPKLETNILTIDVSSKSWDGSEGKIADPGAIIKWGESFAIPALESPLLYRTTDLTEDYGARGPVTVIKVQVTNPSVKREAIPDFSLEGRNVQRSFDGSRIETGPIYVQPGEQKNIHFAISTDADARLNSLNVVTAESFKTGAQVIDYTIGRLSIILPDDGNIDEWRNIPPYTLGQEVLLSRFSKMIDPELVGALMDLRLYKNEGKGYQTAVAKVKLTNNNTRPLPLPPLEAELVSADGFRYAGGQPLASAGHIMPNTSITIAYTFLLPESEKANNLSLKLLDPISAAPFKSTIVALKVAISPEKLNNDVISFYPFDVTIKDWNYSSFITQGLAGAAYSYWVELNLNIRQSDEIVLNRDLTQMEVELVDNTGIIMASRAVPFIGTDKLVNGIQKIHFQNVGSQMESGVVVNIYERIETTAGPAKRLVAQFHPWGKK